MRISTMTLVAIVGLIAVGCGGGSSSPTSPTPTTTTPAASTLTLSGTVLDDAGQPVSGATVTVVDGPNANRTATTDASGRYSITGLTSAGFTVRATRDGYDVGSRGVTLTSSATLDFTLPRARVNLAGALTGTYAWTHRTTRQRMSTTINATVTQNGTAISGTFSLPVYNWTGSFTGTLSSVTPGSTYAGSLTISANVNTGSGRCNGTRSNTTGTATATQLTISAAGNWSWNECVSVEDDILLTLQR